MNIFKRIGNIFMKMAPKRNVEKIPEKLMQPAQTKIEPIRDIEELVGTTKSPYFSPIQTRNQRVSKLNNIKPISSLAVEPVLKTNQLVENPKRKPRETKKSKELKALLEDIKKLPNDEAPIEILLNTNKLGLLGPKTEFDQKKAAKKSPKKSPKVSKTKAISNVSVEANLEADGLKDGINSENLNKLPIDGSIIKDASPVKGKRKSKELSTVPELKVEKWEPNNWLELLKNIRLMRSKEDAPVDTMGCHKCSDETTDEKTQRFHILLALMLSSQTKDQITHEAMKRLTDNGCTPEIIHNMESEELESLLYPVSFYKNKAKYIKNTSKILIEQYGSDIPNNVKELIKLPGVGPKMAHLCMTSAWDITTGIGVDVHVHRISNRLGWVRKETKEPEQTRKELESWLPSDHWREVNHLLVGFGQTICTPIKPKCIECLNKAICPSAFVTKPKQVKKEKLV